MVSFFLLRGGEEKNKINSHQVYTELSSKSLIIISCLFIQRVNVSKVEVRCDTLAYNAWAISGYILFALFILVLIYREILIRERLKNRISLERIEIKKKEELNREKIELFTNVSHELRTPLTLITDPVQRLKDPKLTNEKRNRYLDLISRNTEHLSSLINQLLDFRKAESGKLKANYSFEDAIKVVRQCTESFHMIATNRDITLTHHSNKNRHLCYIDRNKVEQVLFNLISNAFKYTSNGGKIEIQTSVEETGKMVIKIIDNGIGIDAVSQKKIFEPFNTIGSAPYDGNSSGIGLALTKNLVTVLNGKITVESAPQKGTTVTVTFPTKEISDEAIIENEKPSSAKPEKLVTDIKPHDKVNSSKPILLIVEDNEDVQEYLKAELEDDYILHQKSNGIDGLKSAINMVPDIIISDIMMPYMDGIAMCKEIKEKPQTCHIPLVLLSAKTTEENKIEGLNTGADYYISKPFSIKLLKAQLSSIIENRLKLQESLAKKEHLSALEKANTVIDNDFLQKVIDIVQKNMAVEGYNNENLAKELSISQRQLYRKVKALSGSSTQEFIIRVKMDEAVKMMVNTSMTISEVSYALGYSEPSNFTRTFTKHFGQSPTTWIRLNKLKYKSQQ